MSIIVSGGSGFIGTQFCRLLSEGSNAFRIIDKVPSASFPLQSHQVDICDLAALLPVAEGSAIVHLAAEHRDDVRPVSRYDKVNVEGTRNIVKVAEAKGVEQIVFTSSVAVYGFAPPDTGEDGKIAPFNDYGRTKLEAEQVLIAWQQRDPERRMLAIVRPTVVFGPGNRGNVYNLLRQINSGFFVMIGNGRNRKSMAFVDNVAAFLLCCLRLQPGIHLHNYVDKPDFDMNTLVAQVRGDLRGKPAVGVRLPLWFGMALGHVADLVARVANRSLPISAIRVRKFTSNTCFLSSAYGVAGFQAPVRIQDGLSKTLLTEFKQPDPDQLVFYSE